MIVCFIISKIIHFKCILNNYLNVAMVNKNIIEIRKKLDKLDNKFFSLIKKRIFLVNKILSNKKYKRHLLKKNIQNSKKYK